MAHPSTPTAEDVPTTSRRWRFWQTRSVWHATLMAFLAFFLAMSGTAFAAPGGQDGKFKPKDDLATLKADYEALEARVAELEALLASVSLETVDGNPTVRFSGVNVQIVNGSGATSTWNGRGNLIVGYNKQRDEPVSRTGSHYLVIGDRHQWTFSSGIVNGLNHTTGGEGASVLGGQYNQALYHHATVSGGQENVASGLSSSVSGGWQNLAEGFSASVSGGRSNHAAEGHSAVSGGFNNTASGVYASVSGGAQNNATDYHASVSGGHQNTASGQHSSVAGGFGNTASGHDSSVLGGSGKSAAGNATCHPACS